MRFALSRSPRQSSQSVVDRQVHEDERRIEYLFRWRKLGGALDSLLPTRKVDMARRARPGEFWIHNYNTTLRYGHRSSVAVLGGIPTVLRTSGMGAGNLGSNEQEVDGA